MVSLLKIKHMLGYLKHYYISCSPTDFGNYGNNIEIDKPFSCNNPTNVFLGNDVRIRQGCTIISHTGRLIIHDHVESSNNLTVVTGNHGWKAGIWQTDANLMEELNKETDIEIENDVWIGTNVTLLPGAYLSRGCIIAAGSVVNKKTLPYSIYGGVPAHFLKFKYLKDEIVQHERILYPEENRLSEEQLFNLFKTMT